MRDYGTGEVKSNFIAELSGSTFGRGTMFHNLLLCAFATSWVFFFHLTRRIFGLLFFLLRVFILHAFTTCNPKCSYCVEENKHDFGYIFILF